ncbi:MAG TPA: ABC transporter ATP-binding protein [Devosia sp.]|nr:ABC transporter ATP-binding protein [Devosia sp.]
MARGPVLNISIGAKRFDPAHAPLFSDFSLEVAPSSVVALVGPSGVGKSTLLRLVAGIDTAYDGHIEIDGVPARDAPPAGFVFQDARLLPWLSAVDNIRAVRAETTREEAVAILHRVGLASFEDAYPHQLSGGMQRRVALARAVSVNPRLLLLDEPFVSLDRTLVREIQSVLRQLITLHEPTVLLVTHLAEDAAILADRAVVLAGRPVRTVADITFPTPRESRTPADLAAIVEHIHREQASLAPAA